MDVWAITHSKEMTLSALTDKISTAPELKGSTPRKIVEYPASGSDKLKIGKKIIEINSESLHQHLVKYTMLWFFHVSQGRPLTPQKHSL